MMYRETTLCDMQEILSGSGWLWNTELVLRTRMYCLQWLIPVLLLPKPVNPAFLYNHAMFVILYLVGFVLERRPCAICSLVFAAAVFLICYSWSSHCVVWPCEPLEVSSTISNHWRGIANCSEHSVAYILFLYSKKCLNIIHTVCYYCWIYLLWKLVHRSMAACIWYRVHFTLN